MDIVVPADHRVKWKKRKEKYVPGPYKRTEETIEHETDGYTSGNQYTR